MGTISTTSATADISAPIPAFSDTSARFVAITDAGRAALGGSELEVRRSEWQATAEGLFLRGLQIDGFTPPAMMHRAGLVAMEGAR